jgi:hypothetical protein
MRDLRSFFVISGLALAGISANVAHGGCNVPPEQLADVKQNIATLRAAAATVPGELLVKTKSVPRDLKTEMITLSVDGSSCTVTTFEGDGELLYKPKVKPLAGKACAYLKAARKISETLGACQRVTNRISSEFDKQTENAAFHDAVITGKSDDPEVSQYDHRYLVDELSGVADEPYVSESCVCGNFYYDAKKLSFFENPIRTLASLGMNYRNTGRFEAMTADECAGFFKTERERSVVKNTYKELGLE